MLGQGGDHRQAVGDRHPVVEQGHRPAAGAGPGAAPPGRRPPRRPPGPRPARRGTPARRPGRPGCRRPPRRSITAGPRRSRRAAGGARPSGTSIRTRCPAPGPEWTVQVPPTVCARSVMPSTPKWPPARREVRSAGTANPRPSSRMQEAHGVADAAQPDVDAGGAGVLVHVAQRLVQDAGELVADRDRRARSGRSSTRTCVPLERAPLAARRATLAPNGSSGLSRRSPSMSSRASRAAASAPRETTSASCSARAGWRRSEAGRASGGEGDAAQRLGHRVVQLAGEAGALGGGRRALRRVDHTDQQVDVPDQRRGNGRGDQAGHHGDHREGDHERADLGRDAGRAQQAGRGQEADRGLQRPERPGARAEQHSGECRAPGREKIERGAAGVQGQDRGQRQCVHDQNDEGTGDHARPPRQNKQLRGRGDDDDRHHGDDPLRPGDDQQPGPGRGDGDHGPAEQHRPAERGRGDQPVDAHVAAGHRLRETSSRKNRPTLGTWSAATRRSIRVSADAVVRSASRTRPARPAVRGRGERDRFAADADPEHGAVFASAPDAQRETGLAGDPDRFRGYRDAGQCSGLQAGGEGPRWEGRQGPCSALTSRLFALFGHGDRYDGGDPAAVVGHVDGLCAYGDVVQGGGEVLAQLAGADLVRPVGHVRTVPFVYVVSGAAALQLPRVPDARAADRAGAGVRVRAGGVQRRTAPAAAGPRAGLAVRLGRGAVQADHHASEEERGSRHGWARCRPWCCSRPWPI